MPRFLLPCILLLAIPFVAPAQPVEAAFYYTETDTWLIPTSVRGEVGYFPLSASSNFYTFIDTSSTLLFLQDGRWMARVDNPLYHFSLQHIPEWWNASCMQVQSELNNLEVMTTSPPSSLSDRFNPELGWQDSLSVQLTWGDTMLTTTTLHFNGGSVEHERFIEYIGRKTTTPAIQEEDFIPYPEPVQTFRHGDQLLVVLTADVQECSESNSVQVITPMTASQGGRSTIVSSSTSNVYSRMWVFRFRVDPD